MQGRLHCDLAVEFFIRIINKEGEETFVLHFKELHRKSNWGRKTEQLNCNLSHVTPSQTILSMISYFYF